MKNELVNNLGTFATIEGSGFGMTKNELANILWTIAKSGTKASLVAMSAGGVITRLNSSGSAFSAYLVSDKVRVVSKSFEDEQYIWESAAGDLSPRRRHRDRHRGGQAWHEDHLFPVEDQSAFFVNDA